MTKLATGQAIPTIMSPIECSAAACPASGACSCAETAADNSSELDANKAVVTLFFNSQAARNVVSISKSLAPLLLSSPAEYARHNRAGQVGCFAIERGDRLFRLLLHAR